VLVQIFLLSSVDGTLSQVSILTLHVQWQKLGLSDCSHRVGNSHPSHEDGDRSNFQHIMLFRILELVSSLKLNNPECPLLSLISRTVLLCTTSSKAYHNDRAVQGVNCLRSLEIWAHGFESHSRHGCLCLFSDCVLLFVGSGLATAWSPFQGVLPFACRINKFWKRPWSRKRAVEPQTG
jgi:hypothetical protein